MQNTNKQAVNVTKVTTAQSTVSNSKAAILARKALNLSNATARTATAKNLLVTRNVINTLTTARKAKSAKKAMQVQSTATAHTTKYNSIYANVTSLHMLAAMLIVNKQTVTSVTSVQAFIAAYALKSVTNVNFIAVRMQIYFTHANTLQLVAKLQAKLVTV